MLIPPLPRIPDVDQEPMYRAEATGAELSNDYVVFEQYMQWFFKSYYVHQSPVAC